MENIIGKAKSFLEERGIDTSNMTLEEIIAKYNELISEVKPEEMPMEAKEEIAEEMAEENMVDKLIAENEDIIASLTEEQKALFDKLIEMAR